MPFTPPEVFSNRDYKESVGIVSGITSTKMKLQASKEQELISNMDSRESLMIYGQEPAQATIFTPRF